MKYKGYRFSIRWIEGGKWLYVHKPPVSRMTRRPLPPGVSNKRKQLRPHMDALLAVVVLEE